MTLRQNIASDMVSIVGLTGEFGESITYRFEDGTTKVVNAVFQAERDEEVFGTDGVDLARTATVHLSNDATDGISTVDVGDQIDRGGVIWEVREIRSAVGHHALFVVRTESIERSAEGYRREV